MSPFGTGRFFPAGSRETVLSQLGDRRDVGLDGAVDVSITSDGSCRVLGEDTVKEVVLSVRPVPLARMGYSAGKPIVPTSRRA